MADAAPEAALALLLAGTQARRERSADRIRALATKRDEGAFVDFFAASACCCWQGRAWPSSLPRR
jgi:hypothetical protein